jgi:hypothetical protein
MATLRGTLSGSSPLLQLPQRRLQQRPDLAISGIPRGLLPLAGSFPPTPGRADRLAAGQIHLTADRTPPPRPYHVRTLSSGTSGCESAWDMGFQPLGVTVGRVWASGEPAWIPDVAKDDKLPRGPSAARDGLHGAFAFPIRLMGDVHGVIEFYSQDIRRPDRELLGIMGSLGSQVGQFIGRRRAEDDRVQLLVKEQAARAEAEAANRSKDEFLAMLGHELRNPLGAISNAVRALGHFGTRDETVRARELIIRQTEHLARLVDDLLDVGRAMAGKIMLDRQPADLSGIVGHSIGSLTVGSHQAERGARDLPRSRRGLGAVISRRSGVSRCAMLCRRSPAAWPAPPGTSVRACGRSWSGSC